MPTPPPVLRPAPTALAGRLRGYRDRARLTRKQVASRVNISVKLLESWEHGRSIPSPHMLAAWFSGLGVPYWYRETIVRLSIPDTISDTSGPHFPDADDQRVLALMNTPACYQMLPVFDLIGANDPFRQRFPGLEPPVSADAEPVNILLWQLLDERARDIIVNWYPRTHVLLTAFRIMAPDLAPDDRVSAIVAKAQAAPEFTEMWNSDPDLEALDPLLRLRTATGEPEDFRTRSWLFDFPRRPFHVYVLIPQV